MTCNELIVVTGPTVEPVTLEEALQHCHGDSGVEDSYIEDILIPAARQKAEEYQQRAYLSQTLKLVYDSFPDGIIELPRSPVISVSSLKYFDTDDTEYTFSSDYYMVNTSRDPATINLNYGQTWPSVVLRPTAGFEVNYVAGYGTSASDITDKKVKLGILFLVGFWYENRGVMDQIPDAFYNLLRPTRLRIK